jgi:hypothetical protein
VNGKLQATEHGSFVFTSMAAHWHIWVLVWVATLTLCIAQQAPFFCGSSFKLQSGEVAIISPNSQHVTPQLLKIHLGCWFCFTACRKMAAPTITLS